MLIFYNDMEARRTLGDITHKHIGHFFPYRVPFSFKLSCDLSPTC